MGLARLIRGRLSRAARNVSLVVMAAAAVCGLAVWGSGSGTPIEHALHDARDSLRAHPASGRFVLVEIDARSLAALDHWPWPRHLHAQAIDALQRAGAQAIAFDVDFSARSTPAEDRALARAIDTARVPIILPTFRQQASQTSKRIVENLPLPAFRSHAELAAVNIHAGRDGMVRHYPYGVVTGGMPRPSIGAMLAGAAGRAGADFPIDGAIDPLSIPRISYVDLIRGAVPPGSLKGKSVLIGATAIELGDRYPVPRKGVIPGPVIQLLAAETLAGGTSAFDGGPVIPLVLAMAALALALRVRERWRTPIEVAGAALLLALPFAMEALDLGTMDVVPALAALFVGSILAAIASAVASFRRVRTVDHHSGLPNRRALEEQLDAGAIAGMVALRVESYRDAAGVLGQERAAELIKRIVDRLMLISEGAIYRLEESVLAWPMIDIDAEECLGRLDAAARLLRAPVEVAGRQVELRFAFGMATGEGTVAELTDHALLAADHAVEHGRRWEIYTSDLDQEHDWRMRLAGELDQALAAGDIWVAYQPKFDIKRGRIAAAEALVRWRHPTRGAIPPDAFIPALEASGRILDLTLYVLRQAVRDAAGWRAAGRPINVAVNVSALLTTDEAFLASAAELLDQGAIPPELLTLEVTESATMADPDRAVAALERLAAMGIKLSIDDYGTGQSTLSYLKRLPAREIKIDKSFVLNLDTSRGDQAMVRSTIELAHELGYSVVAEGIETAEVLELLAAYGCDLAQGWHIGRPVPAEDFAVAIGAETRRAA